MRVAARIPDACDLQMQLSHQWRTERARRQLRHRTERLTLCRRTTYVGEIDLELDPAAKPTLQPPTYWGTEGPRPTERCDVGRR